MRLKNVRDYTIGVGLNDWGDTEGYVRTFTPGAEVTIYDEEVEKSETILSLIRAGHLVKLGNEEPEGEDMAMPNPLTTYSDVAYRKGLTLRQRQRFVIYMLLRWGNTEIDKVKFGYAEEWADRFISNREREASDSKGLMVLEILDNIDGLLGSEVGD